MSALRLQPLFRYLTLLFAQMSVRGSSRMRPLGVVDGSRYGVLLVAITLHPPETVLATVTVIFLQVLELEENLW